MTLSKDIKQILALVALVVFLPVSFNWFSYLRDCLDAHQNKYTLNGVLFQIKNDEAEVIYRRNYRNLDSVVIPGAILVDGRYYNVSSIGNDAFKGCSSLTHVTIKNGVKKIGDNAFSGCSVLKSIEIPNSVNEIGKGSFHGCFNIKDVVLPQNLTKISEDLFRSCFYLKNINIPSGVEEICSYAFYDCYNLESVDIPNTVSIIGSHAFSDCKKLKMIKLSSNIESIGFLAFNDCTQLDLIIYKNKYLIKIGIDAFAGCKSVTFKNAEDISKPKDEAESNI